jgi:nucleoside phosphorylase
LNRVGIVCALAAEARHFGPATWRQKSLGSLADGTLLAVSGMGASAAAAGARALIEAGVTALVSFGLAGGLDPSLSAGAIFLPSEVIAADAGADAIVTAQHWREQLGRALAPHGAAARGALLHGLLVHGRLLSSPTAVGTVAQKAQLFRQTGACAVDMESWAVGQVASSRQLPFLAVRVIVDAAADVLPRAVSAAADSAGTLQLWRLLGVLARSPADLAPLLRLALRYRVASRSLARVARAGALVPHAFS